MARPVAKKYLNVKYNDRELAKRLGARWDASVQRWYCPAGAPLETIFRWRSEAAAKAATKAKPATAPRQRAALNENFELPLLTG